jgi:uncharacterized protein (DUF362 family)
MVVTAAVSEPYCGRTTLLTRSEYTSAAERGAAECFRLAGLHAARYGTPRWNPLAELVAPGETVLIKPNLVKECHPRDPEGWRYVVTHGSLVRALADYLWKAMDGRGRIIVADAPQTDSSFREIARVTGLWGIERHYRLQGLDFRVLDLRKEEWTNRDGVIVERRALPGDPEGYVAFDLAELSEFHGHAGTGRYYGADYDTAEVNRHHSGGQHEYLVAGTAIRADVVISLPKLKTHKKAGVTVALKNLVGINGDKNWLPHHTDGHPGNGGDEHPHECASHGLERRAAAALKKLTLAVPGLGGWVHARARRVGERVFGSTEEVIRSGNWWGNDTTWRMCLDLNRVLLYGRADGRLRSDEPTSRKRHYVLVDGIVAGQGNGPMNPDPVPCGLILFGTNAPSVDAAAAVLMGFDPDKIPIIHEAFRQRSYPLADRGWQDVRIASNKPEWNGLRLDEIPPETTFHFEPHFGWKGHIERTQAAVAAVLT